MNTINGPSSYSRPPDRVDRSSDINSVSESMSEDVSTSSDNSDGSDGAEDQLSLSAAERELIQREFPDNPKLSMELYGRDRNSETVNPDALGTQIDLRG